MTTSGTSGEDNPEVDIKKTTKRKSRESWNIVKEVLPHSRRVLLYGPSGVGKTYAGTHMGGTCYNITVNAEMSPSALWGHYIPASDGGFEWHDGVASRAWRDGSVLCINEIDNASGALETELHAVLDDPDFAKKTLDSGETIHPHENFRVIATMNGTPDDLQSALRDRFPVAIKIDKPCKEALAQLPVKYRPILESAYSGEKGPQSITYRLVFGFVQLTMKGVDEEIAAQATWGPVWQDVLNQIKLAISARESISAKE